MQRVAAGVVLVGSALGTAGCLERSEVLLTVIVREPVLESVPAFPARIIVDGGETYNRQVDLCEWSGGFVEIEVAFNNYPRCAEQVTLEAMLAPLEGDCVQGGVLQVTQDWPEARYGHGTLDVFTDDRCKVIEERTLAVGLE